MTTAGLRLAVTGGRGYSDRARLFAELDHIVAMCGPLEAFMVGDATGADALAWHWAVERGIPESKRRRFEANWAEAERLTGNRRAAGPMRNGRMLREGKTNLLLAFPGRSGTADCVRQAKALGIRVVHVEEQGSGELDTCRVLR